MNPHHPPRKCSHCRKQLGIPKAGRGSVDRQPKEVWICPDRHEAWTWSLAGRRWLRESPPAAGRDPSSAFAEIVIPLNCPNCRRRMTLHDCRDYRNATDEAGATRLLKWMCACGFEDLLSSTPRAPLVLVVDPNDDSRALMRVVFETGGLAVAEHHQGRGVIDEVARLCPDLIVLEEWLPHVDGHTACHQLRRAAETIRHTPVIFISSSSSLLSARRAFEAGCTLYFIKPVDIHEVRAAAIELITRARVNGATVPAVRPLDTSSESDADH